MKDILETLNSRELKKRAKVKMEETSDELYVKEMLGHSRKAHLSESSLFKLRGVSLRFRMSRSSLDDASSFILEDFRLSVVMSAMKGKKCVNVLEQN
uniref:Uncharacterized protein n=1 Tax=Tanacetum cinerariifolium TaxID=118510 RepID=A0A6L2J5L5_TANCI|nr:hypothetical protein [Tanacetum cinerariifolium]